jgi:hypothetical protein
VPNNCDKKVSKHALYTVIIGLLLPSLLCNAGERLSLSDRNRFFSLDAFKNYNIPLIGSLVIGTLSAIMLYMYNKAQQKARIQAKQREEDDAAFKVGQRVAKMMEAAQERKRLESELRRSAPESSKFPDRDYKLSDRDYIFLHGRPRVKVVQSLQAQPSPLAPSSPAKSDIQKKEEVQYLDSFSLVAEDKRYELSYSDGKLMLNIVSDTQQPQVIEEDLFPHLVKGLKKIRGVIRVKKRIDVYYIYTMLILTNNKNTTIHLLTHIIRPDEEKKTLRVLNQSIGNIETISYDRMINSIKRPEFALPVEVQNYFIERIKTLYDD